MRRSRGRCRVSDLERHRQGDDLVGGAVGPGNLAQQQPRRLRADLQPVLPHGGERRDHELGRLDVVEADQRHVLGHPQPARMKPRGKADGELVRGADHRRGVARQRHELGRHAPGLEREVPRSETRLGQHQPMRGQRPGHTGAALGVEHVAFGAAKIGDVAVPKFRGWCPTDWCKSADFRRGPSLIRRPRRAT